MRNSSGTMDRLLAALTVILSLVVLLMLVLHYPQYLPQNSGSVRAGQSDAGPQPEAPQQVRLDYLYADWCTYCSITHPAVVSVAMRFGPALSLNEYDEALRSSDPHVAALYADYKKRQVFSIFPTLVAHGPKGESALAGMQTEDTIQEWLCAQYTQPPAACQNAG